MNPKILKLRNEIKKKINEARKVSEAGGETRDLNADEQSRFDSIMTEVSALKSQVARLESLDVEEDEVEDAPVEEPRSRRSAPIEVETRDAPAIHTSKNAPKPYQILNGVRARLEHRVLGGLEGEINQELFLRSKGIIKGDFLMPLGLDPEMRALMAGGRKGETRDLTTSTGAGSIFTKPDLPMIELLRANVTVMELGARLMNDLNGNIGIPRQTSSSAVTWVGEGTAATPGTPAVDQVVLSPKVAIAGTIVSKELVYQSSLDAESFVKEDLALSMGVEWDRVAINGSGGAQPTGLLQNSAVTTLSNGLSLGTNGGPMTWGAAVALVTQIAGFNADRRGSLGYLTNPSQRGKMTSIPKVTGGYNGFIFEPTPGGQGAGEINGYKALASTNVPSNLTKGSGTGLSAVIFGAWRDLLIGSWSDSVGILVNPFTGQMAGSIQISMSMGIDVEVRHPQSFAVYLDAA